MGLLQSYALLLLKHPGKILSAGVIFVLCLFGLTLLLRPFPTFSDPLVGFEARGTIIASRSNAFKLLSGEQTASTSNLSLQPNSDRYEFVERPLSSQPDEQSIPSSEDNNNNSNKLDEPPIIVGMSTQLVKNGTAVATFDEDEDEYYKSVNSTQETRAPLMHYSLGSSRAFCGKLYEGHAQVVIAPSTKNSNSGLFNFNSMIAICQLDRRLRLEHSIEDNAVFQSECERFQAAESETGAAGHQHGSSCCNSWSLPNYIACLHNRTSCMDLKPADVIQMEQLLLSCAPYYFRAPYGECFLDRPSEQQLAGDEGPPRLALLQSHSGWTRSRCGSIPDKCLRCNGWTYTVMNYLVSNNFVQPRANNTNKSVARYKQQKKPLNKVDSAINKLSYTNVFLPIARSTSLMKYYQTLSKYDLKTPYAQVKAMDLGLKNSLFEQLISKDAKLFMVALVSILIVISIYTWSFLISLVIIMIICLSLCLSYCIYELVLNIPIFPFMNLLAVVISFGICSDNAMLFCKHWSHQELPNENAQPAPQSISNKHAYKEQANLDRVLKRAIISTSIATLATACSFAISAISGVVAVRCFCIYATLSVITNYLLIVALLPPALIIDSRISDFVYEFLARKGPQVASLLGYIQTTRETLLNLGKTIHNVKIFNFVTKYKFYLIITFISILCCASVLVFHKPGMGPPDDDYIQLLSSKHTFEQYDRNLRKQFAFERARSSVEHLGGSSFDFDPPDTLPIRVVFGVKPVDNGNHFDSQDGGALTFDSKFDLTEPNTQIWLVDFCHRLRQQRFVHPSSAIDLTNCFMDTFKSWMEARSCIDPVTGADRSPCCQSYEFPFTKSIFNKCIGLTVSIIHKTPKFNPHANPGIYFFKNSTKVAAIVVEYQSNRLFTESYTKMERFYSDVDDWVSWQINNTAPPGLRSGWFISSNVELLALQEELEQSTSVSILLEIIFAMLALLLGTRDLVLTIAGTFTIGTIIISTIAALILFQWTLGVAESILISLTIGLSIDFALHYSVAFSERRRRGSIQGIIHRILDEVGSPIALATITTSLAGFVIVWSDILAYQELGVFLMLIAIVSWSTSTFFLLPMLATISSILEYGELYFRVVARRALKVFIDRLSLF